MRQLDGFKKRDVQERFKGCDLPTETQALKHSRERSQQPQRDDTAQRQKEQLMRDFMGNIEPPANDNKFDIVEQLNQQQAENQARKRDRGLA